MTLANTPAYWPTPPGGWPGWLWTVRYDSARHPGTADVATVAEGANCQLYTYALLNLYGLSPRPHRSSELWGDRSYSHPAVDDFAPLDVASFTIARPPGVRMWRFGWGRTSYSTSAHPRGCPPCGPWNGSPQNADTAI